MLTPEEDPLFENARQIDRIVENERQRRKRMLLLWSTLLLLPLALAIAALLNTSVDFNSPAFAKSVKPMVRENVGEQLKPVVVETLGPQVDEFIEAKVSDKIQGASPARVEELSKEVRQVSAEVSQAQAGLRELETLRANLPQLRERISANDSNVRSLAQRVEVISNRGPERMTAEQLNQLERWLAERLESRLAERFEKRLAEFDRSVQSLQEQMEKNSSSIRALAARVDKLSRAQDGRPDLKPQKEREQE